MKQQFKTLLLACAVACGVANAQTYPDKPITLVVPFAAGGPTDVVARMIAIPMGKSLGQTVLVENTVGKYNVTVLPGSYLAREAQGFNPGAQRVRMALVAETSECVEAARRIAEFIKNSR